MEVRCTSLEDLFTVLSKDGADSVMLSAMVEVTEDGHKVLSKLID